MRKAQAISSLPAGAYVDARGHLHLAAQDDKQSRQQSRRAKKGTAGEQRVADLNKACERAGLARLRKVPTPTVWRDGRLVHSTRSDVDFEGFTMRGARHISVEVKHVEKGPFQLEQLEPHQREHLRATWIAGGISLLVVVHGPLARVCPIPWPEVRDAIVSGCSSLDALAWRSDEMLYLRRWVE